MLAQEGEIERFEAGGQPPVRLDLVKEGMAFLGDGVDAVFAGDESLRRGGPVDQLDHRVGELGGVSGLLAVHALPARHEFGRLLGVVVDAHLGPQGGVADDEQVGKEHSRLHDAAAGRLNLLRSVPP